MRRLTAYLGAASAALLVYGCISMEMINERIKPYNQWVEKSYDDSRFEQRYQFAQASEQRVRAAVIAVAPKFKMKVTSDGQPMLATGPLLDMFPREDCERWRAADEPMAMKLSSGLIRLSCQEGDTLITTAFSTKPVKQGTLIILDYEIVSPKAASYGVVLSKRPTPEAAKQGAEMFWKTLRAELGAEVRPARKEDIE